ncbi:MAG: hypothetical protein ACE10O_06325 [Candidatus Acidiferrales bacterium]
MASLFGGAVSKDTVSRAWRKVQGVAFRCPVAQRASFRNESRTHLTSFGTTPKFLLYQMLEF